MTTTPTAHSASDRTDFRGEVSAEMERLHDEVLHTEKAHFAVGQVLRSLHSTLGLVTCSSAAGSAGTVVADVHEVHTGGLAVLAAITSAALTFVKPDEMALRHAEAGKTLNALRVRMRQVRRLDLHSDLPEDRKRWRELVEGFAVEKAAIDADSPTLGSRAFRRARARIAAGHVDR